MRLYISGPMTGIEDHNFPAFNQAEKELRRAGYGIENPATKGVIEGWTWEQYLRYDIKQMMECEGVATLPGYHNSKGAQLETDIARKLSMPIASVGYWVWLPIHTLVSAKIRV